MREVSTYGNIKDGILMMSRKTDFDDNVKLLGDCQVKVIVKKLYKKRSTRTYNEDTGEADGYGQNGYYWYIVVNLFCEGWKEAYGEPISMDKAHSILKNECNYTERVNMKTGEILKDPQSTADKTTVEFEEYLDRCRKWIFEWFSIEVPLPNEHCGNDWENT